MAADQVGMEVQIKALEQFPFLQLLGFSQTAPERGHKNSNVSLRRRYGRQSE
jgi:hypothetical protein